MTRDRLTRFVFDRAAVRGAHVVLHDASRAALSAHDYPPSLRKLLGELIAAATLLAASLKFRGSLSVQLQGAGPLRLLVVECDHALAFRATAQWDATKVALGGPDATLAELAGDPAQARLVIVLDTEDGGLYQGIVELASGSVARMIEHYLATSEQLDSRMVLAERDGVVAGVLLQRLPDARPGDEEAWARAAAAAEGSSPVALLEGGDAEGALAALLPDDDLRLLGSSTPSYACRCSAARVENALRIAGLDEVEAALAHGGQVDVTCEFCGRHYTYGADAARALFAGEGESARVDPAAH